MVVAAILLLLVMLLARWVYLPRLGNGYDLEAYRQWTAAIQRYGPAEVFQRTDTDYVGYHYLLWLIGAGYRHDAGSVTVRDKELRLWLKAPGIAGDLISTVLVVGLACSVARRAGARLPNERARALTVRLGLDDAEALALGMGALWGLHPALIYTSAYWGQNDSLVTAFALASLWAALRRRPTLAAMLLAAGAILKPQPLIVAPVIAAVVYQRSGWRGIGRAAAAGAVTLLAGHLYFIVTGHAGDVLRIYRNAALTPQRLNFSAYNLWWPVAHARDPRGADTAFTIGGAAIAWGTLASALVLGVLAVTVAGLLRRRDDAGALLACAYLIFGFFAVGSGVHERYDLPALAFVLPALPLARRWALPALVLSATITINAVMGIPLDRLYPQGHPVWLSMAVSTANVALLGWMTWLMASEPNPPAPFEV